jgi:hypothetical protein
MGFVKAFPQKLDERMRKNVQGLVRRARKGDGKALRSSAVVSKVHKFSFLFHYSSGMRFHYNIDMEQAMAAKLQAAGRARAGAMRLGFRESACRREAKTLS